MRSCGAFTRLTTQTVSRCETEESSAPPQAVERGQLRCGGAEVAVRIPPF